MAGCRRIRLLCEKKIEVLEFFTVVAKVVGTLIAVALIILVGTLVSCEYFEHPRNYYPNYTVDLHKGLWVPNIFPSDIENIYEQHDIDTNRVWLKFTLGEQAIDLSSYKNIEKSGINYSKPFLTTWWFSYLPNHYKYYRGQSTGSNEASTLAISNKSKEVYWWSK